MKTLCLAVSIAVGAATAAALHAQQTTAPNANRVTVTGCIQRATAEVPTGTSGTVGATASDTQFVLTTPYAVTAGTSGTTATPSNIVYRLEDSAPSKVARHQGEKVEITGTLNRRLQASADNQAATGATAKATRTVPTMKVESVTTVSKTCSR